MQIQLLIVFLFIIDLALIWLATLNRWFDWYKSIGGILLAVIPLTSVAFGQPHFDLDYFWWIVAGFIFILVGTSGVIWTWLSAKQKEGGLQFTAGPYQYVRHPYYLSLIFIWVGWWWIWAAVYAFYFGMCILLLIWLQAWLEEKIILEKKLGEAYSAYKQHTGMFWIK